ncbi:MAG: AAA family ATPase, partial [Proteobacteria bacterium]|nr:AAA family ATPase [Pseudomonadota bacterium]
MPEFDVRDLLRPEAYPHEVAGLRLVETHISWVLLTGPYAYKIKKPVRFDFLDASSAERREQLCHDEIRLNRRFAPELYLDVVPILRRDGHLWIGGTGMVCDHAVRMRQFDPAQQLDLRIQSGDVTAADLGGFALELARFHAAAAAASGEGACGSPETLRRHIMDNLPPLRACLQSPQQREQLEALQRWLDAALERLWHSVGSRLGSGRVRECHGDLHAGNIVRWRGRWLPFDCIEFDPQLRWIDAMNDVAFLYADLCRLGRGDLACVFLSRYLEESGDYDGVRLLPLYAVYRALVRAKVEALGLPAATGVDAGRERRLADWLATALRLTQPRDLTLVIMHGVTGSGKSLLSEALVPVLGAVRIRSDLERKRLEGVPAAVQRNQRVDSGSYSPAMT